MRHPSKVGSFCSRKLQRRRFSDRVLGAGRGPLPCGRHLKRGPKMPAGIRRPWYLRLQDAKRAVQKFLSSNGEPLK